MKKEESFEQRDKLHSFVREHKPSIPSFARSPSRKRKNVIFDNVHCRRKSICVSAEFNANVKQSLKKRRRTVNKIYLKNESNDDDSDIPSSLKSKRLRILPENKLLVDFSSQFDSDSTELKSNEELDEEKQEALNKAFSWRFRKLLDKGLIRKGMVPHRRKSLALRIRPKSSNNEQYSSTSDPETNNNLQHLTNTQFENISSESDDDNIADSITKTCRNKNNIPIVSVSALNSNVVDSSNSSNSNITLNNNYNRNCECNTKHCTLKARLLASTANQNSVEANNSPQSTPSTSETNNSIIASNNPEIMENNNHNIQRVKALESDVILCLANLKNFVNSEAAQLNETISKIPLRSLPNPPPPPPLQNNQNHIQPPVSPPYNISIVNPSARNNLLTQNALFQKYMQHKEELTKNIKSFTEQNQKQFNGLVQQRNECINDLQHAERTRDYFKAEWIKNRLQYLNHTIEKIKSDCEHDSNEVNKFTFEQYLSMLERYKNQQNQIPSSSTAPPLTEAEKIHKELNLRQEQLRFFSNDSLVEGNRVLEYPFAGIITNNNETANRPPPPRDIMLNPNQIMPPIPAYLMQNHTIVRPPEDEATPVITSNNNNEQLLFKPKLMNRVNLNIPHLEHPISLNPVSAGPYSPPIIDNPANYNLNKDRINLQPSQDRQEEQQPQQILENLNSNQNISSIPAPPIILHTEENENITIQESTSLDKPSEAELQPSTTTNNKENDIIKSQEKQIESEELQEQNGRSSIIICPPKKDMTATPTNISNSTNVPSTSSKKPINIIGDIKISNKTKADSSNSEQIALQEILPPKKDINATATNMPSTSKKPINIIEDIIISNQTKADSSNSEQITLQEIPPPKKDTTATNVSNSTNIPSTSIKPINIIEDIIISNKTKADSSNSEQNTLQETPPQPQPQPQLSVQGNPLRPKPALIPIGVIRKLENKVVTVPDSSNVQKEQTVEVVEEIPNKRIKLDISNTENTTQEITTPKETPKIDTEIKTDEDKAQNKEENKRKRHIRLQFTLISNKTITLAYLLKMMNQNLNSDSFSNFILKPNNIEELCSIIRKREIFSKIEENSSCQHPNVLTIMNHFLIYVIVCVQVENKINYKELYLKLIRDEGPIRYDYCHAPNLISLEDIDVYLQKAALELHEAIILNSAKNNVNNNKCICSKIKTFTSSKFNPESNPEEYENYFVKAHGETEISIIVLYEPKFKNSTKMAEKFTQKCQNDESPSNVDKIFDTEQKSVSQSEDNSLTNINNNTNDVVSLKTVHENELINSDTNMSFNFDIDQMAKSYENWEKLLENPEKQKILSEIFGNHSNNYDDNTNTNKQIKNNSSSPDLDKTFDNIWNDMENSNELITMSDEELEKEIVDLLDKDVNNETIRKRRNSLSETCLEPSFKNIRIQVEELKKDNKQNNTNIENSVNIREIEDSKPDNKLIINNSELPNFAKINKYRVINVDGKIDVIPSIHETITNYWKNTDNKKNDESSKTKNVTVEKSTNENTEINNKDVEKIVEVRTVVETESPFEIPKKYYSDPKLKININKKNNIFQKKPLDLSKSIQEGGIKNKGNKTKGRKTEDNFLDGAFLEKNYNNFLKNKTNKKQSKNVNNANKICINFNTLVYINEVDYKIILEILNEAAKPLYKFYKFVNTTRGNNNQPLINFTAFFFGLKFKKLQKYKKMYEDLHKK